MCIILPSLYYTLVAAVYIDFYSKVCYKLIYTVNLSPLEMVACSKANVVIVRSIGCSSLRKVLYNLQKLPPICNLFQFSSK